MKIVFFGSSSFAVPSLRALLNSPHKVLCVVTQPDKAKGRGLALAGTDIKMLAAESNVGVFQPEDINSAESVNRLRGFFADLFVVIAYGQILSKEVLGIPGIMPLNIHASMLPAYRGSAPINRVLISGEKTTGVSAIKMVRKMDAGPIIRQEPIAIESSDTALTLEVKLSNLAAGLLTAVVSSIQEDTYRLIPQDESRVSFAPKLNKADGLIVWGNPAGQIHNLIRGCAGWPGAFTYYKGRILKVYRSAVTKSPSHQVTKSPGEIVQVSKEGIVVAAADGNLVIEELQPEGKRAMAAAEFILGRQVRIGDILGKK